MASRIWVTPSSSPTTYRDRCPVVKLTGTYNAAAKTFTFTTTHLSLYVIGADDGVTQIRLAIGLMSYTVNGMGRAMDAAPFLAEGGRTMVPLRFVAEALGAKVGWEGGTRTATVALDGKELANVIGELAPGMDAPAVLVDGRTMVPLRYVGEALECDVRWYAATRSILISK